jgi:hypothetical protein
MYVLSQDEFDKLCGICPAYFVEGDVVAPIEERKHRGPIERAFDLAEMGLKLGALSFAGWVVASIIKTRIESPEPEPEPPPPFTTEVLTHEEPLL